MPDFITSHYRSADRRRRHARPRRRLARAGDDADRAAADGPAGDAGRGRRSGRVAGPGQPQRAVPVRIGPQVQALPRADRLNISAACSRWTVRRLLIMILQSARIAPAVCGRLAGNRGTLCVKLPSCGHADGGRRHSANAARIYAVNEAGELSHVRTARRRGRSPAASRSPASTDSIKAIDFRLAIGRLYGLTAGLAARAASA